MTGVALTIRLFLPLVDALGLFWLVAARMTAVALVQYMATGGGKLLCPQNASHCDVPMDKGSTNCWYYMPRVVLYMLNTNLPTSQLLFWMNEQLWKVLVKCVWTSFLKSYLKSLHIIKNKHAIKIVGFLYKNQSVCRWHH